MERVAQWKKAKDIFVAVVLKEAPPLLGRQRLVAPVIDKYESQIGPEFKQLDTIDNEFQKKLTGKVDSEELFKMLEGYSKLSGQASQNIATMLGSLQQSIDKFKTNEAPGNPKMKENLVRGLKVLKTALDALDKSSDSWLVQQKLTVEGRSKKLDTFETMAATYIVTLRAALARALAAAQRIKANPKKEVYDNEFPKAARDITQQVGNVRKLAEKGFTPPGPNDTSALMATLKPFADGNMQKVDANKTGPEILAIVSVFNKGVKAVADAYGIH